MLVTEVGMFLLNLPAPGLTSCSLRLVSGPGGSPLRLGGRYQKHTLLCSGWRGAAPDPIQERDTGDGRDRRDGRDEMRERRTNINTGFHER